MSGKNNSRIKQKKNSRRISRRNSRRNTRRSFKRLSRKKRRKVRSKKYKRKTKKVMKGGTWTIANNEQIITHIQSWVPGHGTDNKDQLNTPTYNVKKRILTVLFDNAGQMVEKIKLTTPSGGHSGNFKFLYKKTRTFVDFDNMLNRMIDMTEIYGTAGKIYQVLEHHTLGLRFSSRHR